MTATRSGRVGDDRARGGEVVHDDDVGEQRSRRPRSASGARTRSTARAAPAGTSGQRRRRRRRAADAAASRGRRPRAQVADGVDGRVDRVDRHGVGDGAERGDDRLLVLRVDREQRRDGPDETGLAVRGEQRADAVLAREAELEGLGARLQRGALALGGAQLLLQRR